LKSIDPSYRYEFAYKPPQTQPQGKKGAAAAVVLDEEEAMAAMNEEEAMAMSGSGGLDKLAGAEVEADDVPFRPVEKKRLDWRGKTYLAPLTTVGNLVRHATCHFDRRSTNPSLTRPTAAIPTSLRLLRRRHHMW
jgi:tRNA-dihydrouridine synthase 3